MVTRVWAKRARLAGGFADNVQIEIGPAGRIRSVTTGVSESDLPSDALCLGLVVPGFGNAHSHVFHRALRGRTHDDGGDFWLWRESMYQQAAGLTPDSYRALATDTFREMVTCGYTAVGEFHYVHHRPDGTPYASAHAMESALADAAEAAGIRLVLLDTCYLSGGFGRDLESGQRRFSDGSVAAWLGRWWSLREFLAGRPTVTLGAAIHSVRAVPRQAMSRIASELPAEVPLHIHLSEQPQENAGCVAEYGMTPTALLGELGLLTRRLSVVHATHLMDADIQMLGEAGVGVVLCPSTEADLGDGIGPARQLSSAGTHIAIGSDQNAVIDPLLELRSLEYGERLASGTRGRFTPAQLWDAGTHGGYRALGLSGEGQEPGIAAGRWCDLVELDDASIRTSGSLPEQLVMAATASDVRTVLVGGVEVYKRENSNPLVESADLP